MSLGDYTGPRVQVPRMLIDAAQELGAWLEAKMAEIAAADNLSEDEREAARLLIFKDLGRRASRVIDEVVSK